MPELLWSAAGEHPDRVAFRSLAEGGADDPATWSWGEWAEAARRVAAALVADGLEPGRRVAVLAGSRPLWPVADLGTMAAGLVSVGLYPTSAPAQIGEILRDSGAAVAVVDTPERLARLRAVEGELPGLRRVVCLEPAAGDGPGAGSGIRGRPGGADGGQAPSSPTSWDAWLERGREALEDDGVREELARRRRAARPGDVAALIYTSGSTGVPKGARVSHRYLLSSAASIRQVLGLTSGDTALSFLPFCHAAERVFGLHTRLLCRMEAGLVQDATRVWDAARAYRPTLFGGLPRFYEKLHAGLREGREVADFLGDRLRLATSGGATLPEPVSRGLAERGVTVLGAYGLTEHLCVAFNRPDDPDLTTSGRPMPGTELRIAGDGEILVRRSDLTFSGYLGRPEASREAFTGDGEWLRTGDLGELTPGGFLRVVGRKKDLLALSTGKKVAPAPIEEALAAHPWISRAVLFGEGRKFVSALLVPERAAVEAGARERGLEGGWPELLDRPGIRDELRAAVEEVNGTVSRTESVRRFLVRGEPLSEEAGELTATGKVRRFRLEEELADRLDDLYDGRAGVEAAPEPAADGHGAGAGPGRARDGSRDEARA
jgi:long-chain acyl-CoA synthetase